MKNYKVACVIQGDIRNGFEYVISEMKKTFDYIILSTWKECKHKIPHDNLITIISDYPKEKGLNHRNYQRYSTYMGIKKAKELGCDYVLKWRTDMLPINLDLELLINLAMFETPKEVNSRLVTCSFRNLTIIENDYHSSIPDLFSFGSIDMMEILWSDSTIDYSQKMNFPFTMTKNDIDFRINNFGTKGVSFWPAETELYAFFKERLQKICDKKLTHDEIVLNYMRIVDHKKFKIVWFGNSELRAIKHAYQYPWWTEKDWLQKRKRVLDKEFSTKTFSFSFKRFVLGKILVRFEKLQQYFWLYKLKLFNFFNGKK